MGFLQLTTTSYPLNTDMRVALIKDNNGTDGNNVYMFAHGVLTSTLWFLIVGRNL